MTFSALYVLPALAILILIQRSWISNRAKNMYRSRKQQRRARHRMLFFRALIIALILSTALTMAWPLPPLLEIVQGVMITVAIMTPVCVYIVVNKLWPLSASEKRDVELSTVGPAHSPDLRAPDPVHLLAEVTSSSQEHEQLTEERAERQEEKPRESLEDSLDELLAEPEKQPLQESLREPPKEQLRESFKAPPEDQLQESFRAPPEDQLLESFKAPPEDQLRESFRESPEDQLQESFRESLEEQVRESYEDTLQESSKGLSGKLRRESVDIRLDAELAESRQTPPTDSEQPASPPAGKNAHPASLHSHSSEQETPLDQTLSVGEQLETLDELVDFHDIGDDAYKSQATGPYDPDAPLLYNPLEKAIAVARDAILDEPGIQDYSTENLPAKSRIELSEMVVRLRNDKMKLQKLVIAQKAVIDSEKQAHERTRVVVKDAISVMRHARHGQRIAEKIARRERAERQRLEKDYVKVRRALDNALSTLKARSERSDVEKA